MSCVEVETIATCALKLKYIFKVSKIKCQKKLTSLTQFLSDLFPLL